MRRFLRFLLVILRVLPTKNPQDKCPEEEQENISASVKATMRSAKVLPVNYEEDQVKITNVKDASEVELFTLEDETRHDMKVSGNNNNLLNLENCPKRKCFDSYDNSVTRLRLYQYQLRGDDYDVEEDESEFESMISVYVMKSALFGNDELFEYVLDNGLIQKMHKIIFYEPLHGSKPKLPFTLESFVQYLFVESRDLKLIRVMLRVCQGSPIILAKYDQKLKARNTGTCARDDLMLHFLVQVQILDRVSFRSTIQLMGFRNLVELMRYYENYMRNDPFIAGAMYKLGYSKELAENNMRINEYMYEYDMF